MNFLHYEMNLDTREGVEITLDKRANVKLLDAANFDKYKHGKRHQYYGGQAARSPVRLAAPHAGRWHLVIDLGGYTGTVQAAVRKL